MSTAGPAGWNPPKAEGLASGPRFFVPTWLNTSMSGVNGFAGSNIPEPNESCSLHRLGSPCPDSSTKTSNSLDSPFNRNAIPVGKFSPEAKTETRNPGGTTMSSPLPGLNETDSRGQSGFATVSASATAGDVEARMPAKYPSRRIFLFDAVLRYLLIANLPFAVTKGVCTKGSMIAPGKARGRQLF